MNKKLEQSAARKYFKKPKTEVKNNRLKKLEDSLLALKIYGGITRTEIPFEIPEDEARLSELELVFNSEHEKTQDIDLEKEAAELFIRYTEELNKQKIKELRAKLLELDEESEEYEETLREITDLQKSHK